MNMNTNRVEAFGDAIVAIIITIMVLEFELPDITKEASSSGIKHHLVKLLPYFGTYAFSFLMIATLWTHHHHLFHLLEKVDSGLLWQNFVFLFFTSFIPFATALLAANHVIDTSIAFYGTILLLTTLTLAVMRAYALKHKLLHQDEDKNLTREVYFVSKRARAKMFIGTAAYLLGIVLAFVNVYFAYACFLIPPIIFFIPDGIDNEELADKVTEKNK